MNSAIANVAQIDAQSLQAQRDLKRAQSLRAQNVVSDAELESAQTRLDVLGAQVNAARALASLQAKWKTVPQPSEDDLFAYLKKHPAQLRGWGGQSGSANSAIASEAISMRPEGVFSGWRSGSRRKSSNST